MKHIANDTRYSVEVREVLGKRPSGILRVGNMLIVVVLGCAFWASFSIRVPVTVRGEADWVSDSVYRVRVGSEEVARGQAVRFSFGAAGVVSTVSPEVRVVVHLSGSAPRRGEAVIWVGERRWVDCMFNANPNPVRHASK